MNKFPKSLRTFFPQIIYVLFITAFFFLCGTLYEPKMLDQLLRTGEGVRRIGNVYFFNFAILIAILAGTLMVLRVIYYLLREKIGQNWFWYMTWCVFEVIAISCFSALYLTLMAPSGTNYFPYLGRCFGCFASLLVYPYVIVTLGYAYRDAMMPSGVDEGARLRFYDHRHLLKFITTASSVLYIESDENYINIHYTENGSVKKYQIRNTMKSVEPLCEQNGFVRTHRSYIVNPTHIKLIRKDEMGSFVAELDHATESAIPVSKKYYSSVTALL